MLTLFGVGFYSYMCAWLSPIPTESVDEGISPRFFIVSFQEPDLIFNKLILTYTK